MVRFDNVFNDAQSQPHPFQPLAFPLSAVIFVEQKGLIRIQNARSVVFDEKREPVFRPMLAGADGERQFRIVPCERDDGPFALLVTVPITGIVVELKRCVGTGIT